MKNKTNIKWKTRTLLVVSVTMLIQFCASPQKQAPLAQPAKLVEVANASVTYGKDIQPIMENSCTPCHYPERGKKELLHTYEATAEYIDDILYRIELPADSTEFMPFKSKKPALSKGEIDLFKKWLDQGLNR